MAVTKLFAIRTRLDDRVNYVTNGEKTALNAAVAYATNPEKTEQFFFTTALNCERVDTALAEMQETKRRFQKTDGVLGYHFIQSFQPGEVTPEQAHALGVEFAKRLFGNRYEVVIATHLDKHHLHNHLVVNSVSLLDGKKYHSSPGSYYHDVRGTSDELCRENNLSIIAAPEGKGRHYAEWKAAQNGKPTIRSIIRADIDEILSQAYTYESFWMLLRRKGYEIRRSPTRKYPAVRPPGGQRFIRLDSLGEGYTEADILRRLSEQRAHPKYQALPVKHWRMNGTNLRTRKITGFYALYFRYLYLLRGVKHRKAHLSFSIQQEVLRLERYQRQARYLWSNGISSAEQLEQRITQLSQEIRTLETQRKPLYEKRRQIPNETNPYDMEIQQKTAVLREKRQELRLCRRIQTDIPKIAQQCQQSQTTRQKRLKKEAARYEYQWRNR